MRSGPVAFPKDVVVHEWHSKAKTPLHLHLLTKLLHERRGRRVAAADCELQTRYWYASYSSPSRAATCLSFGRDWLCGVRSRAAVSMSVEKREEALQSLGPALRPAPGAALSGLLHSLVIRLSPDSALLKAALERRSAAPLDTVEKARGINWA